LMVIAVYPNSPFKYDVIWSQLECFAGAFDRIIISAPREFTEKVTQFVKEVKHALPELDSRLDAEFYVNNRYDFGLWCDALIKGNALKKVAAKNGKEVTYVGGHSQYNRFLLINDSMMAVKKSNEFLEALIEKNASLISLSYWGDKEQQMQHNAENNSTNNYHHATTNYWLESPLRAFSLEGIQIYADTICALPEIKLKRDCPHFFSNEKTSKLSYKKKIKRCIVEKSEIDVSKCACLSSLNDHRSFRTTIRIDPIDRIQIHRDCTDPMLDRKCVAPFVRSSETSSNWFGTFCRCVPFRFRLPSNQLLRYSI